MTQAYNLSQLANNLTSTGLLDAADGLVNAVPIANGGTGATTAAAARTNLGVPALAFAVPSGGIIMWSGSVASIPSGWLLCDGTNGTPNLTNRFVVAAGGSYAVGASGGSADAIVVSHSHTGSTGATSNDHSHGFSGTTASAGSHSHTLPLGNPDPFTYVQYPANGDNDTAGGRFTTTSTAGEHSHTFSGGTGGQSASHTHSVSVSATGSSGINANLPPYYALAYIMKS
jgi:hypothetical protein